MKAYELKKTGVESLGEIPKHWESRKIKNRFFLKPSNVDKKSHDNEIPVELCNYVDVYYNDFITNDLKFMVATATAYEIKKFSLELEDVVLTKDSEDPMDIGVPSLVKEIKPNLVCGYHLTMLRKRPCHVSGSFLFWVLADEAIASQLYREATGVTRWAISSRNIKNVAIAYPKLKEQKAIAEYLDKACQNIDKTISLKQQQLEKLAAYRKSVIHEAVTKGLDKTVTMKDSGVEWLGEVPEHWKVSKLKLHSSHIGDGIHTTPQYVDDSEYYFINGNNFKNGRIKIKENTRCVSLNEFEKHYIDLISPTMLISLNGTIGSLAIYDNEKIILGKSAGYISPLKSLDLGFLYYYCQSFFVRESFNFSFQSTTINNLSLFTLRNLKILLPSISEQLEIKVFLDSFSVKMDKSEETIKKQIKTLTQYRQYRQSLIHECVTGKKRIYFGGISKGESHAVN